MDKLGPILFFTDLHIDVKNVSTRKITLWDEMSVGLEWIAEKAKSINARAVLFGGDLTDNCDWKTSDTYKLTKLLKSFGDIPILSAIGNHDVPGSNLSMVPFTPFGIAAQSARVITTHTDSTPAGITHLTYGLYDIDNSNYMIGLVNWGEKDKMFELFSNLYKGTKFGGKKLVVSIHLNIGDEPHPHVIDWKELDVPLCVDYLFAGDIHKGFPIGVAKNGKTICGNPGAVCRKTIQEAFNKPGIFLLYEEGKVEWEEIPLPQPEAIFNLEAKKEQLAFKNTFKAGLEAAKQAKSVDPVALIKEVATESGFSMESQTLLIERLKK